jgi:hypothetical protein
VLRPARSVRGFKPDMAALVSERMIFWIKQDRRKANFAPALSGTQRSAYQILQFCVRDACGVRGP